MKICPKCLRQYGDEVENCEDDRTELRTFNDQALRLTGKVLDGRFRIDKKLAEGGMGEIFAGMQLSVNRPIAIKVLRPAMAVSEEYVNRFFREANIASTISHPNFVHIYDFGQDQEHQVLYLAMEYLTGEDLYTRMNSARMRLEHILEVCIQICAALEAAHAANIVHRDLKPENIFLIDNPGSIQVKVLDFGIAKELGNTSSMTKTGQIFGTPDYMSPEQCQSQPNIDGRSDLYSLGCILFELITGEPPFTSTAIIQVLLAHVNDPLPDLRQTEIVLPSGVVTIVQTLLQKRPEDRYSTATTAKRALENELARLLEDQEAMDQFVESTRNTAEWKRTSSDAKTLTRVRQGSQLINLGAYESLSKQMAAVGDSKPESPKRRLNGVWAATIIFLGLAVAALVYQEKHKPTVIPNPAPTILTSTEVVLQAMESAITEVHLHKTRRAAEVVARSTSILATSIAMLGPLAPTPEVKTVQASPRLPKNPVLDIRTSTSIERNASRQSRGLMTCYTNRSDPDQTGSVSFSFRILPDGSVDAVQIRESAFEASLNDCIVQKVGKWTFGEAKLGTGIVSHQRTVKFGVK